MYIYTVKFTFLYEFLYSVTTITEDEWLTSCFYVHPAKGRKTRKWTVFVDYLRYFLT